MQLRFHRLELDFTEDLALFLPKSLQLRFLILKLNFTEDLGLVYEANPK